MSDNTNINNVTVKKKKPLWKKLLKGTMWTIIGLVLLVFGLLQAVVCILTPERLTPLTEKYLTQTLNANVDIDRVELTIWSTFPDVTLEIDKFSVISNSLKSIDDSIRAQLPSNADSLLSLGHFRGGINIHKLLVGKLSLYDIQLHQPMVNLVVVDSINSNFNILPPSEPEIESDTATTQLPIIEIDHFAIIDAKPIKFFSLADSIDVALQLNTTYLDGTNNPQYTLDINGNIATPLLGLINLKDMPFILNGGIKWNQASPAIVELNAFNAGVDIFNAHIDGRFDLGDEMTINELNVALDPIKYSDIKTRVPQEYASLCKDIYSDAAITFETQLTKPYNLSTDTIPWAEIKIDVPQCKFKYGDLNVDKFKAKVNASLKGENLNNAIVDIAYVSLNGMGINCNLSTTASSLISDPLAKGKFSGMVSLEKLPPFIKKMVDGKLSGKVNANTEFNLRLSHLDKNNFHKAKVKGDVEINDLNFQSNDTLTNLYARNAVVTLGTSESFVRNTHRVDSLLTASIKVDTCALIYDTHKVRFSDLKAGVGCANLASSLDSTQVNPIGGTLRFRRLNYVSEADTMRVRLRDVKCFASLRRFKKLEKVPELSLRMDIGRAGATTKEMRVNLRESNLSIKAHLQPRRKMSPQVKRAFDCIIKENPTITNDSAYAMARREVSARRKSRSARIDSMEKEISTIDFGVDRSTRALLNRWNVKGSVKAKSARVFTPYFPLRNRISDVDIEFTTDSVAINSMQYKAGRSNFSAFGSISNIKKAISGRSRQPLKLALILRSDTIDVNQLADAAFAGAAFAEKASTTDMSAMLENTDDEAVLEATIAQEAESQGTSALLVPMNIDGILRVSAKNIIYSDMLMNKMSGNIQIYRGSLRLDQLRATTDMGSVNLSALYSAPTKKNMSFGFGLELKDFYIDKVLELVPAIDSVMPLLRDIKGIINADLAATADLDTAMNFVMPSLNAAIKLEGDSLVLMDAETFRTVSKWLLFKNKKKNMVDKMAVEVLVKDSQLELFPFMFNIDRYKLGVLGYNDLAMNFNYHVSVLKSPIPFKFGITVKGNPDKMKVRLGKAKFKENMAAERVAIVDTTRINLLRQIENVFRRGVDRSSKLKLINTGQKIERFTDEESNDTISHADSLLFIQEGVLPAPPEPLATPTEDEKDNKKKKDKKK